MTKTGPALAAAIAWLSPALLAQAAFDPLTGLPLDVPAEAALAFGDVDRDGDADLILGSPLRLYLNDGRDFFVDASSQLGSATQGSKVVLVADLDGDGDLDAFLGGPANTLLVNDGTGTFTDRSSQLPAQGVLTLASAAADMDGDGDLDLVLGGRFSVAVWLNSGGGVFASQSQLSTTARITALALADFDGDGLRDVAASSAGGQSALFRNRGGGQLIDATASLPVASFISRGVAAADVDADGDQDLVFADTRSAIRDRLYINDGTGVFADESTTRMPTRPFSSWTISAGDVDADGDNDLIAGGDGGDQLLLNDGSGVFVESVGALPADREPSRNIHLFDLDADGDLDVGICNWRARVRLYKNDGAGTFFDSERLPSSLLPLTGGAVADVDLDGAPDLAIGVGLAPAQLFLNDGSGVFSDVTPTAMPGTQLPNRRVVMGDVDGDGDADMFLANFQQDRLYVNTGVGSGSFVDETTSRLPPDNDLTEDAALFDADGDGDLDIFKLSNTPHRLLINDGTGVFVEAVGAIGTQGFGRGSVVAGDVDRDGDLDLVLSQGSLLLNDGTGAFVEAPVEQLPVLNAGQVKLADVDGDQDLDILTATGGGLYLNDGGTFSSAFTYPFSFRSMLDLEVVDFDGDGDLDVIGTDQGLLLFVNDGAANFTEQSSLLPATTAFRLLALDADGDGDDDIAALEYSLPNRLLLSLHTQLDSPLPASVGRWYWLEAYVIPGSAPMAAWAVAAISGNRLSPPLSLPWGSLHIDPTQWVALPPRFIPAPGGMTRWVVRLPQEASIVGRTIYAQALVERLGGGSVQLTNLVPDVVRAN